MISERDWRPTCQYLICASPRRRASQNPDYSVDTEQSATLTKGVLNLMVYRRQDSNLVLVRVQHSGDVFSGGTLQVHQLLLQVWDLLMWGLVSFNDKTTHEGIRENLL